ncbi:hypothetical protein D3C86_1790540 [compost metagenome]
MLQWYRGNHDIKVLCRSEYTGARLGKYSTIKAFPLHTIQVQYPQFITVHLNIQQERLQLIMRDITGNTPHVLILVFDKHGAHLNGIFIYRNNGIIYSIRFPVYLRSYHNLFQR